MLTRKKEMSGSMREKRGTSPSPSGSTLRRATSRSLESSPSEKSVPNYLKPTLSSSGDTAKLHAKKPVSSTDSALRLARRRSFDKPPSPTRTLKTRGVSPTPTTIRSSSFSSPSRTLKTRGVSPTPTFRSSSFSGKTTTSPKGERSLKGGRDAGKQPSLYARSVSNVKKSSTLLGKKAPKLDNASELSDQESPIAEAEQQIMVNEHEEDSHSPVAEQEMDEDTITQQLEEEIQKVDSPTFLEEDDDDTAKAESPTILEETDRDSSNVVDESPKSSEHGEDLEEEISSQWQSQEVKEHTSTNPGHDSVAAPKEAHGKKDMALSNNVIEETATMLREQRGNKVKALAGAFETVISLQDK
ncbi:hypothetical protein C2S53_011247 [Perilla frutescens var. hirtella]|uniref:Calmodulin-binding domain-containing protein n=1 Tax=Perilla frutescens var. hirtella TaxID=608512 RepID=A0AAD4JM60_PERFH|nr:hypothetical protein C2S53_011247 [Perilla frutescens var. hirtella]